MPFQQSHNNGFSGSAATLALATAQAQIYAESPD